MNSVSKLLYNHSQLLASLLLWPLVFMFLTPVNYQSILKKDESGLCTWKKLSRQLWLQLCQWRSLLEWRPFAINAPLFGSHGSRNKFWNTPKWVIFFALCKRQGLRDGLYPTSYRISWTVLLFRNNSTVSLFLCRERIAQPSQTQSHSQFSTCCCVVWKWSVFLQVYS